MIGGGCREPVARSVTYVSRRQPSADTTDTPALKGRVVAPRNQAPQREERNNPKNDASRIKDLMGGKAVTAPTAPTTAGYVGQRDPLVMALARYVEALHGRYPDGPDQMRRESLDARANMRRMRKSERVTAA